MLALTQLATARYWWETEREDTQSLFQGAYVVRQDRAQAHAMPKQRRKGTEQDGVCGIGGGGTLTQPRGSRRPPEGSKVDEQRLAW